jgi:hypothetical protein
VALVGAAVVAFALGLVELLVDAEELVGGTETAAVSFEDWVMFGAIAVGLAQPVSLLLTRYILPVVAISDTTLRKRVTQLIARSGVLTIITGIITAVGKDRVAELLP